jgi:hypothetical protein
MHRSPWATVVSTLVFGIAGCSVNRAPIDARHAQGVARIHVKYDQIQRESDAKGHALWAQLEPLRQALVAVDGAGTPLQPIFPTFEEASRLCDTRSVALACRQEVYGEQERAMWARYPSADLKWALAESERFAGAISLETFLARSHNANLRAQINELEQSIAGRWATARARIEAARLAEVTAATARRDLDLARAEEEHRRSMLAVAQAFQGVGQSMQSQPTAGSANTSSAPTQRSSECSNDYQCGYGNVCVKSNYSMSGVCMRAVNSYGVPTYQAPAPESVEVKTPSSTDCRFSTDCPIGFACDSNSGACVRSP